MIGPPRFTTFEPHEAASWAFRCRTAWTNSRPINKGGKWFLLVTVDVPEGTPIVPTEFIGVDFGVVNLATDNDGDVYTNTETEKVR
jgi:transposase